MPIQQFRYHADNLGYVIHGSRTAMAVDGGAVSAILEFLDASGLSLAYVAVTHGHADHVLEGQTLAGNDDAHGVSSRLPARRAGRPAGRIACPASG